MTLRAKLVALVLGVIALVLTGLGAVLSRSFSGWSAEAVDRDLLERAAHVAGLVEVEDEDEHGGRLELGEDAAALHDPAHPWRVGSEGAVLAAVGDLPWPPLQAGAEPVVGTVVDGAGRAWRVASAAFEVAEHGGSPVVVQVAGPTAPFAALEAPFRRGLLFSLLGALVLGGLGAALLAHRSLAPLRRLADDIAATGVGSLDSTVRLDGLDPELRRVATAFNDLLGRLEAAMRQQRQLVSRASHALRTPVATIRTRAEVSLRREREPAAYREALGEIQSAARDASVLISQLLTLSRLDERREQLAVEEMPVAAVAGEVARLLAPRAEEAGISLELDVSEGLTVTANRGALRELLEALLDNAVRYTPRGGRAGIAAAATPGGRCLLRVWDTGPGIPEKERSKVLERFYRGTSGTASGQPGSGLGLSVVKAIADAHGAGVRLDGRPGGGLEVAVELHLTGAQGSAAAPAGGGDRTS